MFKSTITDKYNPIYFLSDYDKLYPVIIKNLNKNITEMKDFVHTIRQIFRDCKTAINRVKVSGISHLTLEKQKQITDLKKKLLRKRVNKVLFKLIKGFKKKHAEVGTIYIEGALDELKELAETFPSLNGFYKKVTKFIKKYIEIWAIQMELSVQENITTTSNVIESKNSIFKAFSKKAKCFEDRKSTENFFSAVALMENFDIKSRGKNKGTSAVTRSGLNLSEFGATDFFEAVNINKVILGSKQSCENVFIEGKNIELAAMEKLIS
jgi:hypothetical protein